MTRHLLVAWLCVIVAVSVGCEKTECPLVPCPPSLVVSVAKSSGQFSRGGYSFLTVAEGSADTCEVEIAENMALSGSCGVWLFAGTEAETLRVYYQLFDRDSLGFALLYGDSVLADTMFAISYRHVGDPDYPDCGTCPEAFAGIVIP